MKTLPLADARILAPLVAYLEKHGARSERYLDRFRIPSEQVEDGGMVAKRQIHDLLLAASQRERYEEICFAAYSRFELTDIGVIGDAMASARTVKEALEIFVRLGSLAFEGNEYFLQPDGEVT